MNRYKSHFKNKKLKETVIVSFNNKDQASRAIAIAVEFLCKSWGYKHPRTYDAISFGIQEGITDCLTDIESEISEEEAKIKINVTLKRIINSIKSRIG